MQTVSFQLYSARNFQPFAEVFRILADAGYRQVEGYSALYAALDDAAIQQVKADLDRYGLTMPSAHFGLDMLEDEPERVLAICRTFGIEAVYWAFYWYGPSITYNSTSGGGRGFSTTYYDLMVATDGAGLARSFLASEENFRVLQELHRRNLFVPVVGNFAGPKALRAVGDYVRSRGSFVMAYYLSNVEQYLYQDGLWQRFCANVASLPLDDRSTFIRSMSGGGGGRGLVNYLGNMRSETRGCGGQEPAPRVR